MVCERTHHKDVKSENFIEICLSTPIITKFGGNFVTLPAKNAKIWKTKKPYDFREWWVQFFAILLLKNKANSLIEWS